MPAGTFFDDGGGVSLTAAMEGGSPLPSWMTFDPLTRTFAGTPDAFSVGDNEGVRIYRVGVTATDGEGASTTTILNLAVRGPNPGSLVIGSEGNDTLTGTPGPDVIYGLGGNDTISGGAGIDTYVLDHGFGHDIITGRYINQFGNEVWDIDDIISFGAGIAPSDITVQLVNSFPDLSQTGIFFSSSDPTLITGFSLYDVRLSVAGTDDSVLLQRQQDNQAFPNFHHSIEQVRFADGTVWSAADVTARMTTGGSGNDTLGGDNSANTLTGGAGNDRLIGQDDDTLIGGRKRPHGGPATTPM